MGHLVWMHLGLEKCDNLGQRKTTSTCFRLLSCLSNVRDVVCFLDPRSLDCLTLRGVNWTNSRVLMSGRTKATLCVNASHVRPCVVAQSNAPICKLATQQRPLQQCCIPHVVDTECTFVNLLHDHLYHW